MGELSLVLFGRVAASIDGEPVPIRSRKASALLAYLAVRPERCDSRERLATLLWGDMREDRARHNLRQTLSLLRKALGEDVLDNDITSQTVTLDIAAERVDVVAFEKLARSEAPEGLRRAVAMFGEGDLLGSLSVREEPFEEWLARERLRLFGLASAAHGKLSRLLAAEGDADDDAIEHTRAWLATDPTCEDAHRLLMQLLDRAGHRSAALRQYEHCVRALAEHLSTEPEPATRSLYAELRDQQRTAPAPSAAVPPSSGPLALPDKPSLAVMPFDNLDPDPARRYFSDGITEDVITALSRFHALFVISRSSSFTYRDRQVTAQQVGRELGVRYVVDGSVRVAGNNLRVTAHLVDAATDKQLWSHRYDRQVDGLFELQDELVQTIVATVADRVEADSIARVHRKPTASMVAYDYVLRGIDLHRRCTLESTQEALRSFEQAIELDDRYALAHAWVACAIGQLFSLAAGDKVDIIASGMADPEGMRRQLQRAYDALQRSRALDEDESECHRLLGAIQLLHGKFDEARLHIERAYALNPNNDLILSLRGELLTYCGRPDEGADWLRRAMRANPYHGDSLWSYLARALYHQGLHTEALDAMAHVKNRHARDWALMAACAARADRPDDAARFRKEAGSATSDQLATGLPYARPEDLAYMTEGLRMAGWG